MDKVERQNAQHCATQQKSCSVDNSCGIAFRSHSLMPSIWEVQTILHHQTSGIQGINTNWFICEIVCMLTHLRHQVDQPALRSGISLPLHKWEIGVIAMARKRNRSAAIMPLVSTICGACYTCLATLAHNGYTPKARPSLLHPTKGSYIEVPRVPRMYSRAENCSKVRTKA